MKHMRIALVLFLFALTMIACSSKQEETDRAIQIIAEAREDTSITSLAQEIFTKWATINGEPYRDAQVLVKDNDGFYAHLQIVAWFRPGSNSPWEEREASLECRKVGDNWQCDRQLSFGLTDSELARRANAKATAVAQIAATATRQAVATATAEAVVATVNGVNIETQDFRKRILFEQANLQSQLFQYQQFDAQFGGGQSLFASQISQIQDILASPSSLGLDTIDKMIEEEVLKQKAIELGISVGDEEVDAALREEVAAIQGEVTIPQATSTAAANAAATAVFFTPTPIPMGDIELTATPEPQETRAVLTDASYQEGLKIMKQNLQNLSDMDMDTYREISRSRLLRAKLSDQIGSALVTTTEEQVHARHILLQTETPALANELRRRIVEGGESFATIAVQYSDDSGSAVNGGDLGWFPRGMMVSEFEDAAFSLPLGEVSEPIKTGFGYHLIQVLERDENRPKDASQITQEENNAFSNWVSEQVLAANVDRRDDLINKLP